MIFMKLIEAKCPKCKELITVDGDSDSTRCDYCGEKIDVKEALVEKMMDDSSSKPKKKTTMKKEAEEEIEEEPEKEEETEVEEEVVEEEPEAAPEPKKRKSSKKVNKEEFEKNLAEAERLFNAKNYKNALNYYVAALELNPNDKYCEYRKCFIDYYYDINNKDVLYTAYDALFEVDYCFDENGNKTDDVTILEKKFFSFVYELAFLIRDIIKKRKQSIDNIKIYFNTWYSYLYMFENYCEEDIPNETREKTLTYIIGIIDLLSGTYYSFLKSFRDYGNLSLLSQKRKEYVEELAKINPNYEQSIKDTTKETNIHNTNVKKEAIKKRKVRFLDDPID